MNYLIEKKIPGSEHFILRCPLSDEDSSSINTHRAEIKNILAGQDPRLLFIVGPCSAWPKEAVLQYAKNLAALNTKIKDHLKIVMRVYIQKPRTISGWTGAIYQPDPLAAPDVEAGMKYTREMMVKVIQMGLPIASEALFTQHRNGFLELLSWIAIGARSSENQEHRIFASATHTPVGLKNPTHGSLATSIHSVVAAQRSHTSTLDGYQIKTYGNDYAHLVLRGSNEAPNYSIANLDTVKKLMQEHEVRNPAVIIDVSHDNSIINGVKDYRLQPQVIFKILKNFKKRPDLWPLFKGFMLESFLQAGNQQINCENPAMLDRSGLSITDPCLGWKETEHLLLEVFNLMASGIKP